MFVLKTEYEMNETLLCLDHTHILSWMDCKETNKHTLLSVCTILNVKPADLVLNFDSLFHIH